jgi:hypothetical protein
METSQMRSMATRPTQETHGAPTRSPELLDLLQPSAEQRERVSELLESLMSRAREVDCEYRAPNA